MEQEEELYHIHRLDKQNGEWKTGETFAIKKEEDNDFFKKSVISRRIRDF